MRIVAAGPGAWLVEVGSAAEAAGLYALARRARLEVTDLVPGARTVLFDGVDWGHLDDLLAGVDSSRLSAPPASGNLVEVPTTYDGPDLAAVAELWQVSVEEAIEQHTTIEYVVAFCGFAPGFAYCAGLPPHLAVPRLPSPRSRVPAGAVGVAGEFTGIYPGPSPGGWRLLGRTDLVLWQPASPTPATLTPGTRVRFVAVGGG